MDSPRQRRRLPATEKLSHLIAREIVRDVASAGWRKGTLLSTERDLLERHGVSRATLREAIRILETQGIVTMRRGIGLEVVASARDSAIATLVRFISLATANRDDIADARRLIAGHVGASTSQIELCMLTPGLKGLFGEDAAIDRIRDWYRGITGSLTDAAESPILALFLEVLDRAAEATPDADQANGKLAQGTALKIMRDIDAAPVGERLGTEPEFAQRYGVSRVTLREALSLLEMTGILVRRRGIGGGLFKGSPDAALTVEMAVSYLRFLHPSPDDIAHARLAIEPALAALTSRTVSAEQQVRLRECLAGENLDNDGKNENGRLFHVMLAEFNGNRPLALLVRVLMYAWSDFATAGSDTDFFEQIYASHEKICDAVARRDSLDAFAAMVCHLEFADRSMRAGQIFV